MRIVRVVHLVVVSLYVLDREALVVGEGEVLAIALEVVLGVALGTDEGAHVLVGLLGDIFATTLKGFVEGGACGHRGSRSNRWCSRSRVPTGSREPCRTQRYPSPS